MIDYRDIIKNRELRLKLIQLLRFIPDEPYLKMVYWIKTGKKLNLKNPQTFCDKLNWLKLHDRHPEYSKLADKITVKEIVKEKLGYDACFETLGVYDHYDDIDFDSLPNEFVMKCNHDSGSVKIIHNKNEINHKELRKFFEGRLKIEQYLIGREYSYKGIKPKILIEKYMVPEGQTDITDYKFFCFDGEPKIVYTVINRYSGDTKIDYYDMDWNYLNIVDGCKPKSLTKAEKPKLFEELKETTKILSKGIKFVRIDLYEVNGTIYLGEYTFYENGGFVLVTPDEWNYKLGELIKINND